MMNFLWNSHEGDKGGDKPFFAGMGWKVNGCDECDEKMMLIPRELEKSFHPLLSSIY